MVLPACLQGDPVWLESDDRVRVTAIYHADGWGALGSMLESIEWLQVEKVEKWDPLNKTWKRPVGW